MINSALEMQVKSTDKLLRRLIEERDGKKFDATSANLSSTYAVSFTQTNTHTSGPSAGSTSMSNLSAQPMNHFYSQTTIKGPDTNLGMPQQATVNMFGQGYTKTTPCFNIPNPGSAPYTSNSRAYTNPNSNYQASHTTIAYTGPISLPVVR
jgi:hypothetical protein